MTVRLLPSLLLLILPFAGCLSSTDALSETGFDDPLAAGLDDTASDELRSPSAAAEPSCLTCSQYATNAGLGPDAYYDLCEDSLDIQVALATCVCGGGGACADACGDNVCSGGAASDACNACMLSLDGGCGAQAGACLADV